MSERLRKHSASARRWTASAAWTAAVVCVLFAVTVLVRWSPPPLSLLSTVVSRYDLYVVLFTVATIGLGAAAVRAGARTSGRAVAAVAAVCTAVALVPAATVWHTAGERDADLSAAGYFVTGLAPEAPAEADAVYAEVDGRKLRMDVYRPDNGTKSGPTVVRVHGGAWTTGQRGESPHWNTWLTRRGYTVVDIDYRLAPPERWEQAPGDVKCAVGRLKAEAGRYGVDPDRMMLFGQSSGGHLALMAAYGDTTVRPSCDVADTSVDAVAAMYPVTDIGGWWRTDTTGLGSGGSMRVAMEAYTGGTPRERPAAYDKGSPTHYIRKGLPPTLLIHGDRDHVVRPELSTTFARELDAAGVPHTLVGLPYADHTFDAAPGSWGTQLSRDAMSDFLRQSFPAPPKAAARP